jgi:predicted exporter
MTLNQSQGSFLVLLCILIALTAFTARFQTDISAFFIAGNNAEEILLASEIQSGTLSRRTVLSVGSIEKKPIPPQFINEFTTRLKAIPGVVDVWKAGENRDFVKAMEQLYLPYGPQLFSRNPAEDLTTLFSENGLIDRADGLRRALLSPQSEIIKQVAKIDPFLFIFNGFKSLQQLQSVQKEPTGYENLLLETTMSGMDVSVQSRIQQQIKTVFAELTQPSKANGFRYQLDMTGVPIFAAATQGMMEADIELISTLSSIALTVLFFWIFRSVSVFFWVSCLMAAVIASTLLIINLIFGSIHIMTLAIGSTLVGVCVDYPIHALVHAQCVDAKQRTLAIAKIWPSMLTGAVTTSVGYVALGLSGYPGFQQVAVYAGTGIFVSLLLTRFVLPNLISGIDTTSTRIPVTWIWIKFCNRFRPALLFLLLIFCAISMMSIHSLKWLQDLQQLTPEMDYLKIKDQEIRSRMISIEPGRFVLVSAPDVEQALQKSEQVYHVLDRLKKETHLSDYFGLYPWILSEKQQHENAQTLQSRLTDEVQRNWQKALVEKGLSVEHLGHIDIPTDHTLTLQQVLKSPIGRILDNQIVINKNQTLIIIWLGDHNPEVLQKALADIPKVQYFSQRDLLNKMTTTYQERAEWMLLIGFAFIVLLLSLRYRSLWKAILTLVPALLSMLIILAFCSFSEEPLSFLHLVGFLLVISICDDFTIFYQENPGGDIVLTYQAIAASMLTSALGFGCLIVAQTSILRTLSEIVTAGVILGFLLCPIIVKQTGFQDGKL